MHDRLLALASEIIQVGFQSDVVYLGLSNPQLSMLPSGRLGRDFHSYEAAASTFRAAYAAADVAAQSAQFASRWAGTGGSRPPEAAEVNAANS